LGKDKGFSNDEMRDHSDRRGIKNIYSRLVVVVVGMDAAAVTRFGRVACPNMPTHSKICSNL